MLKFPRPFTASSAAAHRASRRHAQRRTSPLHLESLEQRLLLAGDLEWVRQVRTEMSSTDWVAASSADKSEGSKPVEWFFTIVRSTS